MNIKKGSEITSSHIKSYYDEIDSACYNLNMAAYNDYGKANMLYNHSSVLEDILTSNMLSIYSKLNSIAFSYTDSKALFIESFESLDYIDKKFHVDKSLNIDTSNRSLTLQISKTVENKIASVIVEPDSNGTIGNMMNGYSNADMNAISDGDISSIFEYEKYTSIFDSNNLSLVLTLKLEKYSIINTIFVKLYNESAIKYPTVQSIEVSTDGTIWKKINGFVESFTEQNDFYIRFEAEKARYVRIKLFQQIAEQVSTSFGLKNRYSICIREIQIVTNEFVNNGAYVSIPFSTGAPIANVQLTSEYISSNGIEFMISANNGGTWLPITPDGGTISLLNKETGVLLSDNIRSIRVKVGMKRTAGSSLLKVGNQVMQYSSTGEFQLLGIPSALTIGIGGHIGIGGETYYQSQSSFPYNILNRVYSNSGIKLINESGSNYSVKFGEEQDARIASTTLSSTIKLLREYILSNLDTMYTFKIKFVPYNSGNNNDITSNSYDGLESRINLLIGKEIIPQYIVDGGVIKILWLAIKDFNSYHTNIYIDLVNLELMKKVGENILIDGGVNNGINLQFKQFIYNPSISDTKNIITLDYDMLFPVSSNIVISEFKDGIFNRQLSVSEYSIRQDVKNVIILSDNAFSSKSIYHISYLPVFDISTILDPTNVVNTQLVLPQLVDAPFTSKIKLQYKYEDNQVISDTKYYSPICKNYKIELS